MFVRQGPIGRYVADLACRTHGLVVEPDGSQPAESAGDAVRTARLNGQGFSVLRFRNDEVLREREAVCETILAALEGGLVADAADPSPDLRFAPAALSPQGRGMAVPVAPLGEA
jgi:very-short-patch-repair endonuclease